jgi:class 3 adenylate cyclase
VARLTPRERAGLPDSAFAYIDSRGQRRLPIHDEPHVRNALSRFNRVSFEDDAARERARRRLLNAAKRYGIVPVGFIDGQLRSERRQGDAAPLPSGFLTFLMTDIEGSTDLTRRLGRRYAGLLRNVRVIVRRAVRQAGGHEVDARADEYFAVFRRPGAGIEAAVDLQRAFRQRSWPGGLDVRVRAGIHSGRPTLVDGGYVGLAVHTVARICSAAHGGQIVLSDRARSASRSEIPEGVQFLELGGYQLPGLPGVHGLLQVVAGGLLTEFPPLRAEAVAQGRLR